MYDLLRYLPRVRFLEEDLVGLHVLGGRLIEFFDLLENPPNNALGRPHEDGVETGDSQQEDGLGLNIQKGVCSPHATEAAAETACTTPACLDVCDAVGRHGEPGEDLVEGGGHIGGVAMLQRHQL